jgi:hypothetical protein
VRRGCSVLDEANADEVAFAAAQEHRGGGQSGHRGVPIRDAILVDGNRTLIDETGGFGVGRGELGDDEQGGDPYCAEVGDAEPVVVEVDVEFPDVVRRGVLPEDAVEVCFCPGGLFGGVVQLDDATGEAALRLIGIIAGQVQRLQFAGAAAAPPCESTPRAVCRGWTWSCRTAPWPAP